MNYVYFVSYALTAKGYSGGFGNTYYTMYSEITTKEHIQSIEADIKVRSPEPVDAVVLLNFILIRTEDAENKQS